MDVTTKEEVSNAIKKLIPEIDKRFTTKNEKRSLSQFLIAIGVGTKERFLKRIIEKMSSLEFGEKMPSINTMESLMYSVLGEIKPKENMQMTPDMEAAGLKFFRTFTKLGLGEAEIKVDELKDINNRFKLVLSSMAQNDGISPTEVLNYFDENNLSPEQVLKYNKSEEQMREDLKLQSLQYNVLYELEKPKHLLNLSYIEIKALAEAYNSKHDDIKIAGNLIRLKELNQLKIFTITDETALNNERYWSANLISEAKKFHNKGTWTYDRFCQFGEDVTSKFLTPLINDIKTQKEEQIMSNSGNLIQKKNENRKKLLIELYEKTNGATNAMIALNKLANEIGIFNEDFEDAYRYLISANLIEPMGSGYHSAITHNGNNLVEKYLTEYNELKEDSNKIVQSKPSNKIFISHCSKDKKLVQKFIDHVLILGLEIGREEIFCTSLDGMGIKSGEDFKKAIYNELEGAKVVMQIITKNYKTSEVCLNEMGAAWLMKSTVIPLVAPPFNYDIGFIHASTQQLRLKEKSDLIKLYDDHKNEVFKVNLSMSNYLSQLDIFLDYMSTYSDNEDINKESMFFYGEESTVSGKLKSGIFGHPEAENFEDSASYHRYFFIIPDKPINVLSSELLIEEGNADITYFNLERIHISPLEEYDLKKLEGKHVEVTGTFMGGHTAWHKTEVLLRFNQIKEIS